MKPSLFLVVCFFLTSNLFAQPGTLDPTFGTAGIVTTNYGQQTTAMAIQSDEKILVAGIYNETTISILRYTVNGTLDNNFGSGGFVSTPVSLFAVPGSTTTYMSVASVLPTASRIFIGGSISNDHTPVTQMFILAYTPNGDLDSTFGVNGIVYNDTTQWNYGQSGYMYYGGFLALQSDGKIVQGGTIQPSSSNLNYLMAARYNADGSKDATFNFQLNQSPIFLGGASGVTILPDNTIVVAGDTHGFNVSSAQYFPCYVNIPSSGNLSDLPPGKSAGGIIAMDTPSVSNFQTSFVCTYQNTVVIGGTMTQNNIAVFAAARLSNGFYYDSVQHGNISPLDSSFATNGWFIKNIGVNGGELDAAVLQPDGKLLLAGSRNSGGITLNDIEIMRLTTNGSLDGSFGSGGIVTTDVSDGNDGTVGVGLQNGKIVIAGSTTNSLDNGLVLLLRYANDITGIAKVADAQIAIYPNPAKALVHVGLAEGLTGTEISLVDITGRTISVSRSEASHQDISLETLSPGIYLLTVCTSMGSITKKIIKE